MDGNKKGYVAHCGGEKSCCPVPWISDDECRAREDICAMRVVAKPNILLSNENVLRILHMQRTSSTSRNLKFCADCRPFMA